MRILDIVRVRCLKYHYSENGLIIHKNYEYCKLPLICEVGNPLCVITARILSICWRPVSVFTSSSVSKFLSWILYNPIKISKLESPSLRLYSSSHYQYPSSDYSFLVADRVISSNEDVTDEEEEENHHDRDVENLDKFFKPSKVLLKEEVERLFGFIHSWFQRCFGFGFYNFYLFLELPFDLNGLLFRQCICCFREGTNYERFSSITQNLIRLVIKQLYVFKYQNNHVKGNEIPPIFLNKNCWVSDSPEEC